MALAPHLQKIADELLRSVSEDERRWKETARIAQIAKEANRVKEAARQAKIAEATRLNALPEQDAFWSAEREEAFMREFNDRQDTWKRRALEETANVRAKKARQAALACGLSVE